MLINTNTTTTPSTQAGAPSARATLAALVTLLVLAGLDQTLLSTALPGIAVELQGQRWVSWVFAAYLVASTVVIPLYGKLADRWGPRPLLLAAGGLFAAGSLASAMSPGIEALIAARALQGLGGGGLMTLTLLAVAALVPLAERARVQGLLGAAYGVATMLGPLIGGVLVQHLSWRWAMALHLPVLALALLLLARSRFGQGAATRAPLDVAGAGLLAATLVCLLLATRDGVAGTAAGWGLLVIGLTLGLGWALVERRAADPLIPFTLFRTAAFSAAAAVSLCSGVALFAAVVFLPMYLQTALRLSPTVSALHLLPLMLCLTLAARACGMALRAGRSVRDLALAGAVAMALAFAALVAVLSQAEATAWAFSLAVVPLGLGLGLLFPVLTAVSQRSAEARHIGIATATPIMLRALGGALGVSALGTMLSHGMHADVITSQAGYAHALATHLQPVYATASAVAVLAAAAAWALPRRMPLLSGT